MTAETVARDLGTLLAALEGNSSIDERKWMGINDSEMREGQARYIHDE